MSLRSAVVRLTLKSCLKATGLRLANLPEVVDARAHVPPRRPVDTVVLVVERRAFALVSYPPGTPARRTLGFARLEDVLRQICAERIGLAGRAAIPGPKRAIELRRAGRWHEVLEASERVEGPLRARLDAWLNGGRFATYRLLLRLAASF